ncbi:MAG: CPBP family intramembrane metalloprotease [Planctomycetes bacterium]|nr:CPBP family intramembrane metalloprotease [Planctomycetota bacterium]
MSEARTPLLLLTVDSLLSLGALVIGVSVAARMLLRPPVGLLAAAPRPQHSLAEDAVALAVFSYLLAYTLFYGASSLVAGPDADVSIRLVSGSVAQVVGTAVCLWLAARRFEGGIGRFWRGGGSVTRRTQFRVTAATTVLALGVCPVAVEWGVAAMQWLTPGVEARPHPTIESLRVPGRSLPVTWLLWISAAAVAPLAEEVFFRGILQNVLRVALRGRWSAIAGAAVAFTLVHFSQPFALPALFILAVLIGFAYERTGSMLPPLALHAAFNLKTLVWDALSGTGR